MAIDADEEFYSGPPKKENPVWMEPEP